MKKKRIVQDSDEDSSDNEREDDFYDDDDLSFVDSDDEREVIKNRKEKEGKINNSFTGPYPTDPADFKHTDKGPNF